MDVSWYDKHTTMENQTQGKFPTGMLLVMSYEI